MINSFCLGFYPSLRGNDTRESYEAGLQWSPVARRSRGVCRTPRGEREIQTLAEITYDVHCASTFLPIFGLINVSVQVPSSSQTYIIHILYLVYIFLLNCSIEFVATNIGRKTILCIHESTFSLTNIFGPLINFLIKQHLPHKLSKKKLWKPYKNYK